VEDVWGEKYKPELDEDVTDYFKKHAGKLVGRIPSRIASLVVIVLIAVECWLIMRLTKIINKKILESSIFKEKKI